MDTVWTTVKVRRAVLADAAQRMPGLPNSAIVQAGLERLLGRPSTPAAAHRPLPNPHLKPEHRAMLEGQTTVEEMLASCPNCAETLQSRDGVLGCLACGYVRETT